MIFIAFTAVGCVLLRVLLLQRDNVFPVGSNSVRESVDRGLYLVFKSSIPFAAAWSVASVVVRLRQPRPSRRQLMRQPGAVACVVAVAVLLFGSLCTGPFVTLSVTVGDLSTFSGLVLVWSVIAIHPIGIGVGAAWLTLSLSGRWRAEPTWVDRVGRLLGCYWLLEVPFCLYWTVSNWI
jgi:hypothetical protein